MVKNLPSNAGDVGSIPGAASAKDKALQDAVKDGVFEKAVDEALGKLSTGSPES